MKKLSTIFIALTAIALLFSPACKSEEVFNIAGHWPTVLHWDGWGDMNATYDFAGTETSGTAILTLISSTSDVATGTYFVNGLNVTITMNWIGVVSTHDAFGTASADFLTISGTFTQSNGWTGTWTATR